MGCRKLQRCFSWAGWLTRVVLFLLPRRHLLVCGGGKASGSFSFCFFSALVECGRRLGSG